MCAHCMAQMEDQLPPVPVATLAIDQVRQCDRAPRTCVVRVEGSLPLRSCWTRMRRCSGLRLITRTTAS